jgi:hypothetical protein
MYAEVDCGSAGCIGKAVSLHPHQHQQNDRPDTAGRANPLVVSRWHCEVNFRHLKDSFQTHSDKHPQGTQCKEYCPVGQRNTVHLFFFQPDRCPVR